MQYFHNLLFKPLSELFNGSTVCLLEQACNGTLRTVIQVELVDITLSLFTGTMHVYIATPLILALVYRAWSKKSLTPLGILTAFITAVIHCLHPWSVFAALLAVFFLAGSFVTKV